MSKQYKLIGLNPETKKHYVILETDNIKTAIYEKKLDANFVTFHNSKNEYDSFQEKLTKLDNNLLVDQNYVNCKNELIKTMNKLTPLLIEFFKRDGINFKNGGGLYQKNQDEINNIINKFRVKNQLQIYLNNSGYSIYVEYKNSYKSENSGWSYIQQSNYIYDFNHSTEPNFKPYKKITLKQYKKAKIDLKKYENQLSELKSKIGGLNFTYDLKGRY